LPPHPPYRAPSPPRGRRTGGAPAREAAVDGNPERRSRAIQANGQRQLAGGNVPRTNDSRVRPRPTRLDAIGPNHDASVVPCGNPAWPRHAATGRMRKRRTTPYSKFRPHPATSPFYSLLSPFSAAGRCPWGRTSRFVRPLRVHPQPRVAAPAATRGSCPPKLRKPGDPACPTKPVRPTSRPSAALSRTPLGVQVNPGARQPGVFASLDPRLMSVTPTGVCVWQPPRRHQTTSRQPRPTCPTAGAPSTTNRSPVPLRTSAHELPRRGQRK
jgi:hypothetical protein